MKRPISTVPVVLGLRLTIFVFIRYKIVEIKKLKFHYRGLTADFEDEVIRLVNRKTAGLFLNHSAWDFPLSLSLNKEL